MFKTLIFLSSLLTLTALKAQNVMDTSFHLLTPIQMQEDVQFYYTKLLETHPNPFQKITQEQFKQKIEQILLSFNTPLSKEEFYKTIEPLNQVLDEHTQLLNFDLFTPYSEEEIQDKIARGDKTVNPYMLYCFPENSIALLELNTFFPPTLAHIDTLSQASIFDVESSFKIELKKLIDTIINKNCKYLFIDVTANGGGSSNLALEVLNLFQSIVPKKYFLGHAEIKISNASREMFRSDFSSKWGYVKIPFIKRYRQMFFGRKGKVIHRNFYWDYESKNQIYDGETYLIQGKGSYSATIALSSFFKAYKTGIILGEETGGKTNCYINGYPFQLPNSKFYFLCAVQYSEEVGSNKDDRGVMPDIEYKIKNNRKSFTLEQLKEMLQLVEKYNQNNKQ